MDMTTILETWHRTLKGMDDNVIHLPEHPEPRIGYLKTACKAPRAYLYLSPDPKPVTCLACLAMERP